MYFALKKHEARRVQCLILLGCIIDVERTAAWFDVERAHSHEKGQS